MNLANKLTILRIILVPIFMIFLTANIPYGKAIAIFIFILAALTDKLDGYIARSRNQITNFGKFMDPLADKLLVTAALIALVDFHVIPNWIATIIVAREFAVSGLRMIAASEGIVLAASWWGKLKTTIQIIAIIIALISLTSSNYHISTLDLYLTYSTYFSMALATIITMISGIDYFAKNYKVLDYNS